MPGAVAAYRSDDPEVLAAWDGWKADLRAQRDRVIAWKQTIDPEDKLTLHAYRHQVPAYFTGDWIPDGWRKASNRRIVPNKRVKAGKAAAHEMEEVRRAAPRDPEFLLKGVPTFVHSGDRMYTPGIFKYADALYIAWGTVPDGIDTEVWSELKMSEFYAAKEALDAAHEGDLVA